MTARPDIRRAVRADAGEIARLLSPLGYPLTEPDVTRVWGAWVGEGNLALVIPDGTLLLGVITLHAMRVLHRPRPVGRITSLVVDPSARGRGLGRALMQAAEDTLAGLGCGLVEVTSHARRTEAHAFYAHIGYERTSFRFAKVLP